ncbi:kinase-like domain-containing protein, partial [Mycena olivaceomarginata]
QYRTGKTLSGGEATLIEAIHIATGRHYACEVVSKDRVKDWEHFVRNEIAVLKQVHRQSDSANIVKLYDYFQTAHTVYLCLDFCTGGTLYDRVRADGAYPEAQAVDLARTLCFAVKHIHDAGVVHRDLRPENILFRTPDEAAPVMVAGFGLSRIVDDAPYPRSLTFTAGYALQYTAPEMISEGSLPPVDVWSLGILVFFIIAGCARFERYVQSGTEALVAKDRLDDASASARDFVGRCLASDPSRRPTADEALAH